MKKYYCDHCRILYDVKEICKKCGSEAEKKIWIEVQSQSSEKHD